MVTRRHQRVTMWKDQLHGTTPVRGRYSSALCPNGINYCSNDTAWASCCYDLHGTYTLDVNSAFNALQNAGFYGDLPYIFLALMDRESSFTPDVIAVCGQCCCTEIGVWAVGLLQFEERGHFDLADTITGIAGISFSDFQYWLFKPLNNCIAAKYLYDHGGLAHWTPLQGVDSPQSIELWRGRVAAGGSTTTTEPGVSLAADIQAAPQAIPQDLPGSPQPQEAGAPSYVVPAFPLPDLEEPAAEYGGWDNVRRYLDADIKFFVGVDVAIAREMDNLGG